ncbi:MAG: hypothetical protein H6815_01190 [Phycisphaeraceae bacterium]|nr:hypothetical protein [Phycisphaerales bacterium]MCB9859041.1 hypothetical protein [Phycisphaeraceae bacterium]
MTITETTHTVTTELTEQCKRDLLELTQLPTAAGKEQRVVNWVEQWCVSRSGVVLAADTHGNLTLSLDASLSSVRRDEPAVYFTAHMDHPAMVVERVVSPHTLELSLRGGVMASYLENAKVRVVGSDDTTWKGTLVEKMEFDETNQPADGFTRYICETDEECHANVGDIAMWDLPQAEIIDGILHTNACDDLAALAAALDAFDRLRERAQAGDSVQDVRVLLTRAEEIGFIGAIGACRDETMPKNARVIALENSRAFADVPIGGGPIVRVGDRLSIFSPRLTSSCATAAEEVFGRSALPRASQKQSEMTGTPWQRKLMAGGACEATVFCAAGYDATCLCLPLGNYHNMGDLAAVQEGTNTDKPTLAREHIAISDYLGLVDLLVACGTKLPERLPIDDRIESLWIKHNDVLK